jgi:predicted nucleic acid-binding protein
MAVIIVLDACTLINLANGGVLGIVLGLKEAIFFIGPSVLRESSSVEKAMAHALQDKLLFLIDENKLSVSAFAALKHEYGLGDGETECLLAACTFGYLIACDDNAARKAATARLGVGQLTGSIGLLKLCIRQGALTPKQAFNAYELMKSRGGFLPRQLLKDFQ